ncbi:MAG: Crp/Fnr family transcriptional regulator [Synechococcales bacterium]|nr:Crp/Fnr family transcriptional regulator [Synechococcales bacterium]
MTPSLLPTIDPAVQVRHLLEERYQGRTLKTYRRGQIISMNSNDIWVVYRGVVQLSTLYPSGDEAILGLAVPLMPFGLPLTLTQPYQAIALTDVDLMRLSLLEVEQSPALMQCVLHQLSRRLQQTEAFLALAGYRRVEDRLLQLLQLLQHELGQAVAGGVRLNVRLTHQHLANAIGTTRVTVTRLLGQLRSRGDLTIDASHHIILKEGKFEPLMVD